MYYSYQGQWWVLKVRGFTSSIVPFTNLVWPVLSFRVRAWDRVGLGVRFLPALLPHSASAPECQGSHIPG